MLFFSSTLALGPPLLLLWWTARRYRHIGGSGRTIGVAAVLGMAGVALALLIGLLILRYLRLDTGLGSTLFRTLVLAGLVEELSKFLVLAGIARKTSIIENNQKSQLILVGVAVGTGFVLVENLLFVGQAWNVLVLRTLMSVPLHTATGGLLGWALFRWRRSATSLIGLLAASLVHGFYDLFLELGRIANFAAFAVILLAVVSLVLIARAPADATRKP